MSIYDHMEFPPYQYREYPKYVDNAKPHPLGHGEGTIVNSKAEEDAYRAAKNGTASGPLSSEVSEVEEKE